jgi:hypothetical protein
MELGILMPRAENQLNPGLKSNVRPVFSLTIIDNCMTPWRFG